MIYKNANKEMPRIDYFGGGIVRKNARQRYFRRFCDAFSRLFE